MKLYSIQCLRAFAVLLVVHTHSINIQEGFTISWQQHFFFLNDFGAIGADMFFVISGFIICYVADKYQGIRQGGHFLKKRFLRINPVYYIISIITVLVYLYVFRPLPPNWLGPGTIDTIFMIPVLSRQTQIFPLLFVGWTLSFEWYFYLLFTILIFMKVEYKAVPISMLILFLFIIGYLVELHDFRLKFFTNAIMLEFMWGVMIYWIYQQITPSKFAAGTFLLVGLAGYAYNIIYGFGKLSEFYTVTIALDSFKRALMFGLPSACIVAGCIFMEKAGMGIQFWKNRQLLLMGAASYSIYLIHFPAYILLGELIKKHPFRVNGDLVILLIMLYGLGVGVACYYVIERPLLKRFRIKL